ncbi:histidine kinase [Neobacillus pocheonensis]|uniref:sensor histidine kinase n=1 Tax=Neobacillus pocheonensis TaxID=363869 RepID=UPI003D2B55B2
MFQNWGLTKKFVIVFLVLITLPTLLFGGFIYYQTTNTFKQQAETNTIGRLEKNEDNLNSIIQSTQNMSSFMIFDQNFRAFFTSEKNDTNQPAYKQAVEGIKGYLTFQLMSNTYIDSIVLKGKNGTDLEFGFHLSGNEEALDRKARDKKGKPVWSGSYFAKGEGKQLKSIISLTREINDINHINRPIGLVRIRLDQSKLYNTIEKESLKQEGSFFVMTKAGDVVLHSDSSSVGKPFPEKRVINWVKTSSNKTLRYKSNGIAFLAVKKAIQGTDWVSVAMVNEDEVVNNLDNVRGLFILMIVLLILLGVIAFIGYYFSFIKRIVELTLQTRQLEKGDFTANVSVSSQDEIGKLGMRFNKMVETIQTFINRELKLKIKQKESELKALQSQIDPHFLYNTLDMIRWTARLEKAMETGQQIERLSTIFRMNLNMGKMWVRIEEEMLYIQNYLELQKSRLGNRLDYRLYYDDLIKNVNIIKQVLQPLVENSILHGFKNLPRQGIITIRCYQHDDEIWMDVIDNGWGFSKEEQDLERLNGEAKSDLNHDDSASGDKESTETGHGYALKNLKERLELAFGEGAGMEQLDTVEGAWIRLRFKLQKNGNIPNEQGE